MATEWTLDETTFEWVQRMIRDRDDFRYREIRPTPRPSTTRAVTADLLHRLDLAAIDFGGSATIMDEPAATFNRKTALLIREAHDVLNDLIDFGEAPTDTEGRPMPRPEYPRVSFETLELMARNRNWIAGADKQLTLDLMDDLLELRRAYHDHDGAMPQGEWFETNDGRMVWGFRPADFDVCQQDPDLGPILKRDMRELSSSGLLWLINTSVFWPRGFSLALTFEDDGSFAGWELLGDGSQPWQHVDPPEATQAQPPVPR